MASYFAKEMQNSSLGNRVDSQIQNRDPKRPTPVLCLD